MATRTISAAGGNWNATGTWDEGVVPVAGDSVVVRAAGNSGNVTVTAAAACATINLTAGAYNGTFTINASQTLTVTSNITLNSSGTSTGISGTGTLSITGSMTLTPNGKTIACGVSFVTANTVLTLGGNVTHTGLLTISNGTTATQFSGSFTWTTSGGVTQSAGAHTINSGCTLKITGGTWTGSSTTGRTLQGAGTVEIAGNVTLTTAFHISGITVLYTSGTIGGTANIQMGGSSTINGGGTWNGLTVSTTSTLTLGANIIFTGSVVINNAINLTMAGRKTVTTAFLSFGGVCTLTRDAMWYVTTLNINTTIAVTATILGSFDMSLTNLNFFARGTGTILAFKNGQTLTVTGSAQIVGTSAHPATIQSTSGGSRFTLDLTGATKISFYTAYTDVTVTGGPLYNYWGQTLTNTNNIINFTTTPADSTNPGEANVLSGTGYKINGVNYTGTLVGGGGEVSYGFIA